MAQLREGDLFYFRTKLYEYLVCRLIKMKTYIQTGNVSWYAVNYDPQDIDHDPTVDDFPDFIKDSSGNYSEEYFSNATLFGNIPVTQKEKEDYMEHLFSSKKILETKAKAFYKKAIEHLEHKERQLAIEALTKCINLYPIMHEAVDCRGQIYMEEGEKELAIQDFTHSSIVFHRNKFALDKLASLGVPEQFFG